MRYLLLSLILGLVSSCGYFDGKRTETSDPVENPRVGELRTLRAEKMGELKTLVDQDGYPSRTDCDLTLWVGEAKFAGLPVNLDLVELSPGVIHRRPTPCWTPEQGDIGSKSTVSQDMLAGYMLGRWTEGNLGAFQRLAAAGEPTLVYLPIPGWVMGEPYPAMASRVVLRPNGVGVVGRAIYALSSGADDRSYRKWAPLYGGGEDFELHIQAVDILTDALASEAIRKGGRDPAAKEPAPTAPGLAMLDVTMNELEALQSFVQWEPENYFFHAILGRYTGDEGPAINLLLDPATPVPSYVRGASQRAYELIHWLAAAEVVLMQFPE